MNDRKIMILDLVDSFDTVTVNQAERSVKDGLDQGGD
jgi:hypothetical protein